MDDYDYNETPCPKCGHEPTHDRPCQGLYCDDGWVDLYEAEDPINYDPGDVVKCRECNGTGYEHWCPKCGCDLTRVPNKKIDRKLDEAEKENT